MLSENISEKRRKIGNISIFAAVFILVNACWHFYTWYTFTAPYMTVIAFIALAVSFFSYVDIKNALHDYAFWLMVVCDLVALINLFLIGSNKGAILIVVDFLLILYLANKIILDKKEFIAAGIFIGFFFYYWTFDVKGYFKGYNTNFGGLVLITGFVFSIIIFEYLRKYLEEKYPKYAKWMIVWEIFMFAWGYNIIAWYRSRCAFVGLLIMAVFMLIPRKFWKNKIMYGIVSFGMTLGAIAFTGLYVALDKLKEVFQIQIFYKDILSGREEIWGELWSAYLKMPLTGIGSSYEIQVEWMEGLLEVHNGFLDLLFIHGIFVFIVACTFMIFRLFAIRSIIVKDAISKAIFAAMMTMLITSFLENYVIIPPFSLMFLILFGMINHRSRVLCEKGDRVE